MSGKADIVLLVIEKSEWFLQCMMALFACVTA